MPADTTIPVSDEVWKVLTRRKERGDSFDDVLRRLLELDEDAEPEPPEPGPEPAGDVDDVLAAWVPDGEVNATRAREETRRAVAWLDDQTHPQTRSEIVAACAGESELGERSWWERAVQPGLRYLAKQDLVEYRSGYHDYAIAES